MDKLVMFIGFLIFLIFVMLWFCIIAGSRADKLGKKLKEQTRRFSQMQREYNTLNLWYTAQKEALESMENETSSAKH